MALTATFVFSVIKAIPASFAQSAVLLFGQLTTHLVSRTALCAPRFCPKTEVPTYGPIQNSAGNLVKAYSSPRP